MKKAVDFLNFICEAQNANVGKYAIIADQVHKDDGILVPKSKLFVTDYDPVKDLYQLKAHNRMWWAHPESIASFEA